MSNIRRHLSFAASEVRAAKLLKHHPDREWLEVHVRVKATLRSELQPIDEPVEQLTNDAHDGTWQQCGQETAIARFKVQPFIFGIRGQSKSVAAGGRLENPGSPGHPQPPTTICILLRQTLTCHECFFQTNSHDTFPA